MVLYSRCQIVNIIYILTLNSFEIKFHQKEGFLTLEKEPLINPIKAKGVDRVSIYQILNSLMSHLSGGCGLEVVAIGLKGTAILRNMECIV